MTSEDAGERWWKSWESTPRGRFASPLPPPPPPPPPDSRRLPSLSLSLSLNSPFGAPLPLPCSTKTITCRYLPRLSAQAPRHGRWPEEVQEEAQVSSPEFLLFLLFFSTRPQEFDQRESSRRQGRGRRGRQGRRARRQEEQPRRAQAQGPRPGPRARPGARGPVLDGEALRVDRVAPGPVRAS